MQRQPALDQLRALAMLAGVGFHAALAYSPLARPYFPTADGIGSAWVDAVIWWLHLWRMPLFFLISGVLTALLVRSRGLAGLWASRWRRIGLPLLLLAPPLLWTMQALTLHAAVQVAQPSPVLRWVREALAAGHAMPLPGPSHLWFLLYLLWFSLLLWVARLWVPPSWVRALRALPARRLLLALPLALAPLLAAVPAPHPAPESWLPQLWALALFGLFFAWGYVQPPQPARPGRWLVAGWLVYLPYLALLGQDGSAAWLLRALAGAAASVWCTAALFALGQRWLAQPRAWLMPWARASFWIYLVHLPLLLALQYAGLDLSAPWGLKWLAAVGLVLVLGRLSHRWLVQTTPLRRWV